MGYSFHQSITYQIELGQNNTKIHLTYANYNFRLAHDGGKRHKRPREQPKMVFKYKGLVLNDHNDKS